MYSFLDNPHVQLAFPATANLPTCIRETPTSRLWHKNDKHGTHKTYVKMNIRSPLAYATPRHAVLTRILALLVEDAFHVALHDTELACTANSLTAHSNGLLISLNGSDGELPVLMRTIIALVKGPVVDTHRFATITKKVKLEYESFLLNLPHVVADYRMTSLMRDVIWSPAEKLTELLTITQDDIQRHQEDLFSRIYVESLVNGNLDSQMAIDLFLTAESLLDAQPMSIHERILPRSLILPEGSNFVKRETVADPNEEKSCLTYYLHFGDITDLKLRSILDFIVHSLQESPFSDLTRQTCCVFSCSQLLGPGSIGLCIIVESLQDPVYLERDIEILLENFRWTLDGLFSDQLETQKEGLIIKKLKPPENICQESTSLWYHISSGYCDFDRNETDAAIIRTLTLKEISAAYLTLVEPHSPTRRKLSVHLRSKLLSTNLLPSHQANIIEDEIAFKARLELSTSPTPVKSVLRHSLTEMTKPRL